MYYLIIFIITEGIYTTNITMNTIEFDTQKACLVVKRKQERVLDKYDVDYNITCDKQYL